MKRAHSKEIVWQVSESIIPPGSPLPFTKVNGSRYVGVNQITADVTMFDGLPAKVRLTRWAMGWYSV